MFTRINQFHPHSHLYFHYLGLLLVRNKSKLKQVLKIHLPFDSIEEEIAHVEEQNNKSTSTIISLKNEIKNIKDIVETFESFNDNKQSFEQTAMSKSGERQLKGFQFLFKMDSTLKHLEKTDTDLQRNLADKMKPIEKLHKRVKQTFDELEQMMIEIEVALNSVVS